MKIEDIKSKVKNGNWLLSTHADEAAEDENINLAEIRDAILNDDILEYYPDTGRGESCLILGFVAGKPIHAVCGWRGDAVAIITVYLPKPPKFIDPRTRGKS